MTDEQATPEIAEVDANYPGLDAALEKIMGSGDPVQDPPKASQEAPDDDQGEEVEEEGDRSETPQEAAQAPSKPSELSAEDRTAYEKALSNLKLAAKAPEAVLEGMDPQEIIAWWSGLAPQKVEVDRTYRELAEARRRLSEIETTKEAEPAVPTANVDLEAIRKEVEAELGEDATGTLDKYLEARLSAMSQGPLQKVAQLEAALEGMFMERIRGELGIPQLTDPATWEKVQTLTGKLWRGGLHDDLEGQARLEAVLRSAAREAIPDLPTPEQERAESEEAAMRRKGSPTARASKPKKPKSMTPDELVTARAMYIIEHPGATPEQVRARYPDA